ncbi:MAG: hypothetical protein L6U99_02895 [Clostridium sp.]|nr:MAG: hypothetical protein L6U99_02895 [Clostridium sp.]
MANAIALITKYLANALNTYKVMAEASCTDDLVVSNVEFMGTKAVKVPVIGFDSYEMGTYSRKDGFAKKDTTLTWESHELTQDCGDELKIDSMDLEESGTNIIQFYNEYLRRVAVPTIDKYRLKTLSEADGIQTANSTTLTTENLVDTLDTAMDDIRNEEIPTESAIMYVPRTSSKLFKNAKDLTKFISEGNWNGHMSSKVTMYDDAKIVYVPKRRWPSDDAQALIVVPECQASVVKLQKAKFYQEAPGYDGPIVDVRIYHDTYVKAERAKGIYLITKAAAQTSESSSQV